MYRLLSCLFTPSFPQHGFFRSKRSKAYLTALPCSLFITQGLQLADGSQRSETPFAPYIMYI